MSRRIADISNLLDLIDNGTITIKSVQDKAKSLVDQIETEHITSEQFIESLQYLNESKLFRDGIDFFYEFTGRNAIRIESGMRNPYMDAYFYADCMIMDDASIEVVESTLNSGG